MNVAKIVVEFNENNERLNIKNYEGLEVTKELIQELINLDTHIKNINITSNEDEYVGYFKTYFDVYDENNEIKGQLRIDLGDGYEVNKEEFNWLIENTNK